MAVLLRISGDTLTASHRIGDKQRLLATSEPDDLLLVAWPGQRRQDMLVVDDLEAACDALGVQRQLTLTQEQADLARKLYASGTSTVEQISKLLGVAASVVRRTLEHP